VDTTDELADLLPTAPQARGLPHQAAHRARLLAAIAAEPQPARPALRRAGRGWLPPRRWLVPAAAAIAVLAIAFGIALPQLAGGTAAPRPARSSVLRSVPTQPGTRTWQVPLAGVHSVVMSSDSGSVSVSGAASSGTAPVTARFSWRQNQQPPVISGEVVHGTLSILAKCPTSSPHCLVSLAITIPSGMPVYARTNLGDVQVTGMSGSVHVADQLGTVDLRDLSGAVNVTDNLGDIDGTGLASARATMTASLGDIDVSFSSAPTFISASDREGDVTIRVPGTTSYRVSASAQLGAATVQVPRAAKAAHVIRADSQLGSVTILTGGPA